ncbi:hypothetical protein PC115_g13929 [Phytophthora cactorum]|nr:hypothetical protein PC115_g13929 [Phytophthora cactorum]KAG2917273.1 hypothetical protein PC117_g17506 [Phytophthora cactorum]
MFEHVCLGGTTDYSPEFKAIWKVKEPRCKTIVDSINDGYETIKYESWREKMESVFGCPEPTSTNTTSYSGGSWGSTESGSWSNSEGIPMENVDNSNDTIHFSDVLDDPEPTTDVSEPGVSEPTTDVSEPTTDVLEPEITVATTWED